jgi:hypothetical protein
MKMVTNVQYPTVSRNVPEQDRRERVLPEPTLPFRPHKKRNMKIYGVCSAEHNGVLSMQDRIRLRFS